MTTPPLLPPPGWYANPSGAPGQRYWERPLLAGNGPAAVCPRRPPVSRLRVAFSRGRTVGRYALSCAVSDAESAPLDASLVRR
jgi:hypothetical protein